MVGGDDDEGFLGVLSEEIVGNADGIVKIYDLGEDGARIVGMGSPVRNLSPSN